MKEPVESFVLVVMEHGSDWPAHVPSSSDGCVIIRQGPGESEEDLLRRTYERIRAVQRAGAAVARAVLSCSDDPSVSVLGDRVPLARALLAAVLRMPGGQLDLVARASAPVRTRHSLVALAGTLTEALAGTSASVSARFTSGSVEAPPRHSRPSARTVDARHHHEWHRIARVA